MIDAGQEKGKSLDHTKDKQLQGDDQDIDAKCSEGFLCKSFWLLCLSCYFFSVDMQSRFVMHQMKILILSSIENNSNKAIYFNKEIQSLN